MKEAHSQAHNLMIYVHRRAGKFHRENICPKTMISWLCVDINFAYKSQQWLPQLLPIKCKCTCLQSRYVQHWVWQQLHWLSLLHYLYYTVFRILHPDWTQCKLWILHNCWLIPDSSAYQTTWALLELSDDLGGYKPRDPGAFIIPGRWLEAKKVVLFPCLVAFDFTVLDTGKSWPGKDHDTSTKYLI